MYPTTNAEELFAYEVARAALDRFAADPKRLRAFRRTYSKLKYIAVVYAYCDHTATDNADKARAMAYAWEDIQLAFTGHGEWAIGGCILQLWANLRKSEEKEFFALVKEAFARAEEATSVEAPRRYLHTYRLKPPLRPDQDWTLPTILPVSGAPLRDWAFDNNEDPDDVTHQWAWLEVADRAEHFGLVQEEAESEVESTAEPERSVRAAHTPTKRPHLQLVPKDEVS
jgi:hypothetical protein